MSSPTPPDPSGDGDDWRKSVLQSYRNTEVREIAKVLAALEPGASQSSKLSLAMRFEDTIFKSASSLQDYRKRMTKRLKKLQKNYVPPAAAPAASSSTNREQLLRELQQTYGDSLRYITKHAAVAIREIHARLGSERATQLQQHTDVAQQWARELQVLEGASKDDSSASQLSEEKLQKLKQHLERRVDNIRSYVVKHAEPELFLQETLERKDAELTPKACKVLASYTRRRVEQIQQGQPFEAAKVLQESLEKAQVTVPPPTRNQSNDVPAALLHLEKMRAASTALLAYVSLEDRTAASKTTIQKAHLIATQGADFCKQVLKKKFPNENEDKKESKLKLQDAWNKTLEIPTAATNVDDEKVGDASESAATIASPEPAKKKLRTTKHAVYYKSRVLLTNKRKTPSNIIHALQQKRATLVRPPPDGMGTHLILEFGSAFVMTIYLEPLLVTIRAMEPKEDDNQNGNATKNENDNKDKNNEVKTENTASPSPSSSATTNSRRTATKDGTIPWKPLSHGLTSQSTLEVWGVSGDYDQIGHVVEERLRDASTHATHVLRQCFSNTVKDKTVEFEVEILEATALLEFLQLARRTYIPNWQDFDPSN